MWGEGTFAAMAGSRLTRREALVAAALGYGALLTGCGSSGGPAGAADFGAGAGYDGPPVELDFWNGFTGGDGPQMLALADAVTKENPNIRIRMVTSRWEDFYAKLPAAVASGEGPDVALMHVDQIPTNAAHGTIVALDDLVRDLSLAEDDFAQDVWRAGEYRGRRYGIPLDMHPLGLYVNTSVLERAGLDPARPPRTRDEYEAALEELKAKDVQGSWVTPFFFTGGHQFMSLLWQFGGDLTDEEATRATWNSDAGVEALEWQKSLIARGYSPPNVGQDADLIAFKNGQSAFMWNGAWAIGDFGATEGLEWSLAPLPRIGSERAAWSNSHNFVIPRPAQIDRDRLRAAKFLIDTITRSPAWAEAGQVPARRSARESKEFRKLEAQAALAEEVPYLRFAAAAPGLSDVRESTLDLAIAQAINGTKTVREALDESAARADQLLQLNRDKYART
jgi:multiple sugar transport system substrate-binding protein